MKRKCSYLSNRKLIFRGRNKRRLRPRKTTVEEQVMISVSQEYLNGLNSKIQNLEDHVRGLENMNRELVEAVNEKQ
jgi:hypothetical protein